MASQTSDSGGILSQVSTDTKSETQPNAQTSDPFASPEYLEYLKSMDASLKSLLKDGIHTSQSDAKNQLPSKSDFKNVSRKGLKGEYHRAKSSFTDGFEEAMWESVLGSDFKDKIGKSMSNLAAALGTDLEDLPKTFGKELGKQAMGRLKKTKAGQAAIGKLEDIKNSAFGNIKGRFMDGVNAYDGGKYADLFKDVFEDSPINDAKDAAKRAATDAAADKVKGVAKDTVADAGKDLAKRAATDVGKEALEELGESALTSSAAMASSSSAVGAAVSGFISTMGGLGPAIAVVAAAAVVAVAALYAFGPAIEGTKALFDSLKKAGNRYYASRKANLEQEKKRITEDIESMITAPFTILQDAAERVYAAWDSNLRLINGTQGYSKADLQNLMSQFAERLRDEDLSDVIGGTDVTESLSKVLNAGLSGKVAEEFAYIATKLNAAIPTQDFFGYADTYASIAANAIKAGKSESEAIAYATEQLESFASSVLYSTRQLSGGFTTGLKDAQSLFDDAVRISQAAKTGQSAEIGSVMTAVAAITGAIAPDLATSMTDIITKAATGGNSSEIVALRSLAGVNASNTEFLRQVASNPQKVFSTLFTNLAEMQNMSDGAYMEVAEGLSSVFGLSMDAFARIDFNYLAQAISSMNTSNAALNENIEQLASGETTTTAEQMRIAQINKYMIDEGLAYVLDNEVARSIQEHMWQEQLARELMEASYGVEIHGAALEFIEGIKHTIDNILGFLNPFAWLNKAANIVSSQFEYEGLQTDIERILQAGKVGQGNTTSLYQLTSTNRDLDLIGKYIELQGHLSAYEIAHGFTDFNNTLGHWSNALSDNIEGNVDLTKSGLINFLSSGILRFDKSSAYQWNTIGKSFASILSTPSSIPAPTTISYDLPTESISQSAQSALLSKIDYVLSKDYMDAEFVQKDKSYEDFAKAASKYIGKDFNSALKEYGYSQKEVENAFQSYSTQKSAQDEKARKSTEEEFWKNMQTYTLDVRDKELELIDLVTYGNSVLDNILFKHTEFFDAWVDYFVDHTAYTASYKHSDVDRILRDEKATDSDAIYTLANALIGASDLDDPQVQTNALLSQILIVINAIMQQNNKSGSGMSLPDTYSALALGMFKTGG